MFKPQVFPGNIVATALITVLHNQLQLFFSDSYAITDCI